MVRIELSEEDARTLRDILQDKQRELATEINRTDHHDFKEMLRRTARALDRLVSQLP